MKDFKRSRRLRSSAEIRGLVRETNVHISDLIYPMFVVPGKNIKREIPNMPEQYHYSVDQLKEAVKEVIELGIKAIVFFGLPENKDEDASEAYAMDGIVQLAVKEVKKYYPGILVITDVCLCQYTSHGHCGVVKGGVVINDESIDKLAAVALSHAMAGADMVAPSDMMDGRVGRIREILDKNNFKHIPIMSYSVKYASAFYGPFRSAANCAPQFGDRKTYQMDPANRLEAIRQVEADLEEGADIIMVKPALAYLDVIREVKNGFSAPIAAYQVSGEYAMIKIAAREGLIKEEESMVEALAAIKRAGADMILTYFAKDMARWIRRNQ
ncbi:porphobilinogen synthase [Natronincola peptidivorans]|uniref:Delta-aminolevulinic acid dehydratase n=1 Tax=Natronincola peptidivorans TaxID=426128 RepID=A0A1I0CWX0_9FIRM|nr:porphobilinogen synthase [Natronincola peptidivorans]SET24333.1 porphobilinogen synthase [Natronincola peptidivorans]